jgi:hypothetical protein
MPGWLQTETRAGKTLQTGAYAITPFSKVSLLLIPGFHGGLVWNRPASVLVQTPDGAEQVLPVPDPTRRIVWALLGLCAGIGLLSIFWKRNRFTPNRKESPA